MTRPADSFVAMRLVVGYAQWQRYTRSWQVLCSATEKIGPGCDIVMKCKA